MGEESNLIVEGKSVDNIFFPKEPLVVSHAEFHFSNTNSQAITCTILSCHFVENNSLILLDDFHVYSGELLLGRVITIPSNSDLDIRITFPFRPVNPGVNFRYEVRLSLQCGGKQYDVVSKLNIIQEK